MGTEKFASYPLALLGTFALFTQPGEPASGPGGAEGAGGWTRQTPAVSLKSAPVPPASTLAAPAPAPAPAITPPLGRSGAESPELRALRMNEASLFPEYGSAHLDLNGSVPGPASCDAPDYELAKSVELEIPPAGDWLRGLKRPDIAVPRDPKVARYLRYFASAPQGRETFAAWLRRSGAYREIVTSALRRLSLPSDLLAVMFIESGCWPKANSSAGAAGLWQFMPQTARAYGLTVQRDYDERRSIWRSTEAAVAHLSDLHSQFESWHLALAAYNMGYQQLLSRLQSARVEDFFTLSKIPDAMPRETALYVPKILAVAVILRNLEYFGFDGVETVSPLSATRLEVPPNTRLSLLARAAGTSAKKIREMNPQFLGDSTPDVGSPVYAYLPTRGLARAKAMLPRLLENEGRAELDLKVASDFDWGREEFDSNWKSRLDRTKPSAAGSESSESSSTKTETPSDAPAKDSTKTRLNQLAERASDRPSQKSTCEGSSCDDHDESYTVKAVVEGTPRSRRHSRSNTQVAASERSSAGKSGESQTERAYEGERTTRLPSYYRVKPGDTLSQVAEAFKISWHELAQANGLADPSIILAGSRLRIATRETREPRK